MSGRDRLTARQARFVVEYLADLNETQAAVRAGFSARSAHVTGCRMLKDAKVSEAIDKALAGVMKRAEVTAEKVAEGLARIAFLDPAELYDEGGKLKPIADLPEHVRTALSEISEDYVDGGRDRTAVVRRKHKAADRVRALELLGKRLRMFTDKPEVDDRPCGITIEIARQYEDVDANGKELPMTCRCFPGCPGPKVRDAVEAPSQGAAWPIPALKSGKSEGL